MTEKNDSLDPDVVQGKFVAARTALCASLVERHSEIDLILTAMVAGEHCLLVGDPGTAKTRCADSVAEWINAVKFSYLMTKFTDPGEIFGPIDVIALTKERQTRRVMDGYAPMCTFFVADEIFKASSAILNFTLTLLNERRVKVGLQEVQCPLVECVGMSNEWPNDENGGKELNALFDRFLFRKLVKPVSDSGMKLLLGRAVANDQFRPSFSDTVTPNEIRLASEEAKNLPWSNDTKTALWEIRQNLKKEGVNPGDRRMVKAITAARAGAYLAGANEVLPEHLEVLSHVLWVDPEEQPDRCAKVVLKIANPLGVRVNDLQSQAEDVNAKAEEQMQGVSTAHEREGVCREAKTKLEQIRTDLAILKADPRRDAALSLVNESIKDWERRFFPVPRSGMTARR